jgi:NAD-dependent SIR2 family protein deacetylase
MSGIEPAIQLAAEAIRSADALLIGAGAGMGVDSGLPDFRGNEGFWNAYPPFKKLGLSFIKLANPYWFRQDPEQAWGFYGHRRNLYRATQPHAGFAILRSWCQRAPGGYFVFTSNVDGHFQKAGFAADRIVECHGSIEHWQCMRNCTPEIWPAPHEMMDIDDATFRARPMLPSCPQCGALARPNVLMFGDAEWLEQRTEEQYAHYSAWRRQVRGCRLVVIEIGAGAAVPTVRLECETAGGTLIRINPREAESPHGMISIADGALTALTLINDCFRNTRPPTTGRAMREP